MLLVGVWADYMQLMYISFLACIVSEEDPRLLQASSPICQKQRELDKWIAVMIIILLMMISSCTVCATMVDWQQTELDKHQKLLVFSSFVLLYHWSFLPSELITIIMWSGTDTSKHVKILTSSNKINKIQHPSKFTYLNKQPHKFKLQKKNNYWPFLNIHSWIREYYKIKYVDYVWCDIINHIFEENAIISCHAGRSKYNKLYHKNKNIFRLSK